MIQYTHTRTLVHKWLRTQKCSAPPPFESYESTTPSTVPGSTWVNWLLSFASIHVLVIDSSFPRGLTASCQFNAAINHRSADGRATRPSQCPDPPKPDVLTTMRESVKIKKVPKNWWVYTCTLYDITQNEENYMHFISGTVKGLNRGSRFKYKWWIVTKTSFKYKIKIKYRITISLRDLNPRTAFTFEFIFLVFIQICFMADRLGIIPKHIQ